MLHILVQRYKNRLRYKKRFAHPVQKTEFLEIDKIRHNSTGQFYHWIVVAP